MSGGGGNNAEGNFFSGLRLISIAGANASVCVLVVFSIPMVKFPLWPNKLFWFGPLFCLWVLFP